MSRSNPGPAADGTRVGDESHLEAQAGFNNGLVTGMTRGARKGLVMLIMDRWEAHGDSQAGPGLERKSDPSPFWGLVEY